MEYLFILNNYSRTRKKNQNHNLGIICFCYAMVKKDMDVKNKNSILVVDDNQACRDSVTQFLLECNYEVANTQNGVEALETLKRKHYDLIITDVEMPGMTGINLLKRARTITPEIKVIVLSGNGSVDSYLEAMIEGAFEYLTKPVSFNKLRKTVGNVFPKS